MSGYSHPAPRYRISLGGADITDRLRGRLISLTLTDNRGTEADQLDLVLDDHDGLLDIPPHGAKLRVAIGWSDTGLVDKGLFTVDETVHSGAPDQLTIRARSADLRDGLAAKRERSWHATTLGAIAESIAASHGIAVAHVDQTNESDLNLLTRLAKQHDAIATIKADRLLLLKAGEAKTASGKTMPHLVLTRADGDSHSYQVADRDSYSGVIARYHAFEAAQTGEVKVGESSNAKRLRHIHPSKAEAEAAAKAEWQRIQRGNATLTYTLARGRPELLPECTFSLLGIKPQIAAVRWLGVKVTHQMSDSGYTTGIEAESKLSEE
jgi:hypothetical protein